MISFTVSVRNSVSKVFMFETGEMSGGHPGKCPTSCDFLVAQLLQRNRATSGIIGDTEIVPFLSEQQYVLSYDISH